MLSKLATDVILLMQTEVAEVAEPHQEGRGGSSTMPQKRNPISCEMILAIAKAVRSDAGLLLDAMAADHERATGPWHLEWIALPRSFLATAAALYQARFMLEGLIVDGDRMRRNLDITGGGCARSNDTKIKTNLVQWKGDVLIGLVFDLLLQLLVGHAAR